MQPVVIELTPEGKSHAVRVRAAPIDASIMAASRRSLLNIATDREPFSSIARQSKLARGAIRRCGQLMTRTISRNQGVKAALQSIVGRTYEGEDKSSPLLLEISSPELEKLPWEALWDKHVEFLALHNAGAIARLPSFMNNGVSKQRTLERKLRVMSVLASEDSDHMGEWLAFKECIALGADRVRWCFVVSDDQVARQIVHLGQPCELADVDIIQRVKLFRPNILHFFCHGESSPPRIELATRDGKTIRLDTRSLSELATLDSLWLVTLNCCKSGMGGATMYSLARQLSEAGVPAVIAMRKSIHTPYANAFTSGFYCELVRDLVQRLCTPSAMKDTEIPLSELTMLRAMRLARKRMTRVPDGDGSSLERSPDDFGEWTLPIIYLRRSHESGPLIELRRRPDLDGDDPSVVQSTHEASALNAIMDTLVSSGAPESVIEAVKARLADVEHRLLRRRAAY